jgi:hypothetical protein
MEFLRKNGATIPGGEQNTKATKNKSTTCFHNDLRETHENKGSCINVKGSYMLIRNCCSRK